MHRLTPSVPPEHGNNPRILVKSPKTGLKVYAELDPSKYEKGRKVADEEFAAVNIKPSRFHGEWNYVIRPRR
jgi:hypothetical protein